MIHHHIIVRVLGEGFKIGQNPIISFSLLKLQLTYQKLLFFIVQSSNILFGYITLKFFEFAPGKMEKNLSIESIIENSNESIWLINHKFRLIFFNNQFAILYKQAYGVDLCHKDNILELTKRHTPNLYDTWSQRYKSAIKQRKAGNYVDCFIIDGKTKYFEINIYPIVRNEIVVGASVFSKDITEKENAYRMQLQLLKDLTDANKKLNRFTYHASHDLRSPIATSLGLINIIKLDENEENRKEYVLLLEKRIKFMDDLLNDLRDVSFDFHFQVILKNIHLKSLIDNVFKSITHTEKYLMDLIIDIEDNIYIYSDELRMSIMFKHLIMNAIKYRNKDANRNVLMIIASKAEGSDNIKFSITENGIGMEMLNEEDVYEMFFKPQMVREGTGLGLYIVKSIVEKVGGTIFIKSELGKGTTIDISLPNLIESDEKSQIYF